MSQKKREWLFIFLSFGKVVWSFNILYFHSGKNGTSWKIWTILTQFTLKFINEQNAFTRKKRPIFLHFHRKRQGSIYTYFLDEALFWWGSYLIFILYFLLKFRNNIFCVINISHCVFSSNLISLQLILTVLLWCVLHTIIGLYNHNIILGHAHIKHALLGIALRPPP